MKKILALVLVTLVLILGGCQAKNNNLVISKLITASSMENNIIELYNNTDKDINLSNYKLEFYQNGSIEKTDEIILPGTIKSNDYYVVSGNNFNEDLIKTDINYKHVSNLSFNGNDAIALVYKNKIIDLIGYIGNDIIYSRYLTLIRTGHKENYKPSVLFDRFNYITYTTDLFKYVGNDNYEIKTVDQLIKGPELEDRYLDLDFKNGTSGTGGVISTNWNNTANADGDTAVFNQSGSFIGGSLRYFYINTPEVESRYVKAEPFGYVASMFNKEYLLTKEHIQIQSIPNNAVSDTYNRSLGLVWVDGRLSQHLIVREGLSDPVNINFSNSDLELTYKDVPYLTFLQFAEENARVNKWGLFGEKSPDWNYQDNTVLTTSPEWIPKVSW